MKCTTSHRRPPPRSLGCASQACTACARATASDTCGAGGGTASGTSDTLGRLSARGGPRAPTLSTNTRWPRPPVSLASSTSATCASSHGSTPPHSPCAAAEAMYCSRAAPTMQTRSTRGEPPCGVSGALSSSSTELARCVPGSANASTRSENIRRRICHQSTAATAAERSSANAQSSSTSANRSRGVKNDSASSLLHRDGFSRGLRTLSPVSTDCLNPDRSWAGD